MEGDAQEIVIEMTALAPISQVYSAFTTADGWCAWCCETAEVEAVVGGKFHIYTQGYNAYGVFKALEQDRSVAFTFDGDNEPPTLIEVLLEEQLGGVGVRFKVAILDNQQDWTSFAEFLQRTWGRALNNLKAVLETA